MLLPVTALAFTQTKFATEADAHTRCPNGMVLWVIIPTNVLVRKGDPRYGATRGAYICERDAIAAGGKLAR